METLFKSYTLPTITPIPPFPKTKLNEIFSGPFLLKEIKANYLNNLVYLHFNKTTFITNSSAPPKLVAKLIKRTVILTSYYNIKKPIIVIFLDTPFKKTFNKIIDRTNVNSGYSTASYTVVFRREEAGKVLIHELLHQFEVDCGYFCYSPKINPFQYYNSSNTRKPLLINEALVETTATIINAHLKGLEEGLLYETLIKEETIYITKKSIQILQNYGITNMKELFTKPIISDASILEYYIMKAVLLHNLDSFMTDWYRFKKGEDKGKAFYDYCIGVIKRTDLFIYGVSSESGMRMTKYG